MSRPVLDASALMVIVNAEPGADVVRPTLSSAVVSAVNASEAVAKLSDRMPFEDARQAIEGLNVEIPPFDRGLAITAAGLRTKTRPFGLSFADRACLATAAAIDGEAFTTDKVWAEIPVEVRVRVIR